MQMKFLRITASAAIIFLVFFAGMSAAAPRIDPAVAAKTAAAGEEKTPVVVRYKEGYGHRGAVAVYAAMGSGFEERREYKEMNAVAGRISMAALEALMNDPNVASVDYDYPVRINLQDALPLINATTAHNAAAGDTRINGFGETICIIDTGINYTHPDLGGCNATSDINNGSCAKVVGGYNYCANDACSSENSNPADNHGHGTHVTGIAAANGTIRGAAPGASIVMIKALNSLGSGSFSDVEAGIRWCTNNATRLNITVISMSLGTDTLYTGTCDGSYTTLADAINNATLHNISVLAAAGNANNATAISSPGCIANSTAIASSTKTDAMSSFTNRNSLVQLIAPGTSINSTSISGGYTVLSGTSMATPAAAGAFALLHAYERLESGTNLTPAAIRSALNSTGKPISDAASNRNYSRINLLPAVSSLDSTAPSVSVSSPANTTFATLNITLNFTASDNVALGGCWLINTTGGNVSLPGCANITFTAAEGGNNITVYANDTNGNTNRSQVLFRADTVSPAVSLQSPANTTLGTNNITLNFTATDAAISSCFYSLNRAANISLLNCRNVTFLAASGSNSITVYANDTAGNINFSSMGFTVNITVPIITLQSPLNRTYDAPPPLNFTAIGNGIDRCWYSLDGGATNSTLASCGNISSIGLEGLNTLTLYANNSFGNTSSAALNFTVDTMLPRIIFAAPTPSNETFNTTFFVTVNATINDSVSSARLNFNGTSYDLGFSGGTWHVRLENLSDGNYTFNVTANDTANNTNISETRWVYINASRNVTSFTAGLDSTLAPRNISFSILNGTGEVTNSIVDVVRNYTLRLNLSNRIAEIVNFTWLSANASAVVNITDNVTTANITAAFSSSGGVLDSAIWVDMNNFTSNFTPRVVFPRSNRIFYYLSGSRSEPNITRITAECDASISSRPCYQINSTASLAYLQNFSGAAGGNDTQAPSATVSSPTATTYSSTNITLDFTAADNIAVDRCWYVLNGGGNTTLAGCGNITFIAAEGTNTFHLYINDTTGNQNATSINFSVSTPAASTSSGGGGGGGGGGGTLANPNKKIYLFSTPSSVKLNVTSNISSLVSIEIHVTRFMAASISVEKADIEGGPEGDVYQFINITPKDFTSAFRSASVTFLVPREWITKNSINQTTVALYRLGSGEWQRLETSLIREGANSLEYEAMTANFSIFAIAGTRLETEPQETPSVCAQVITPATNGTDCVKYSTPCDVPAGWMVVESCRLPVAEREEGQTKLPEQTTQDDMLVAALAVAAVLIFATAFIMNRSRQKKSL